MSRIADVTTFSLTSNREIGTLRLGGGENASQIVGNDSGGSRGADAYLCTTRLRQFKSREGRKTGSAGQTETLCVRGRQKRSCSRQAPQQGAARRLCRVRR